MEQVHLSPLAKAHTIRGRFVHDRATDDQTQKAIPMNAKILIVDDDTDIVMMLEDRLHASGYETVVATDGQQALDQIVSEAPQLILLDLTLPKVTGLDVLKRLSQMKLSETIPVIVMTAHACPFGGDREFVVRVQSMERLAAQWRSLLQYD